MRERGGKVSKVEVVWKGGGSGGAGANKIACSEYRTDHTLGTLSTGVPTR